MFFTSGEQSNCAQLHFLQQCSLLIFLMINQRNGKIFQSLNIISKLVYYLRSQNIFQIKHNAVVSWVLLEQL